MGHLFLDIAVIALCISSMRYRWQIKALEDRLEQIELRQLHA